MLILQNRIAALDVMRGIALFGIFLVNMMSFLSPLLYLNPLQWWTSPVDRLTYRVIDLFFESSFYPLFSLLFGYSLMIFRERVMAKNLSFNKIVSRRFAFLLMIGCIHAFFIWHGDILMVYAVIGFFTLPFLKMPPKLLLMFGGVLYILANSFFAIFLAVLSFFHFGVGNEPASNHKLIKSVVHIYQQGTFGEITRQRVMDWLMEYNPQATVLLFFTVFPLFLIGAGFSKLRLLEKGEENQSEWKKAFVCTFLIGTLFKFLPYIFGDMKAVNYLHSVFGGSFQAISYAALVVLLLKKKRAAKFLMIFSYLGRMSLTNYLFQSCLASLLFYGYGLQFFDKISLFNGVILAFGIFTFQVVFCSLWLRVFFNGPIEWVWRSFTYLHLLEWKK